MHRAWVGILIVGCAVRASGQPQFADGREQPQGPFPHRLMELLSALRGLGDWNVHYAYLVDAVERTYARNGWDSESDAFSLELIRQVSQIPPWFPQQRFDRAMEIISERYGLGDRQRHHVRDLFLENSWEVFQEHGERILEYAVDAIRTRASGQPFTPEQVARWVQLAQPVFAESRERLNAAVQSLLPELSEDQRELVEQDLRAANRRLADIERLTRRWAAGQWQPADWGLEDDPIQLGLGIRPLGGEPPMPSAPAVTDATHVQSPFGARAASLEGAAGETAGDESAFSPVPAEMLRDPWARYVRQFIEKYRLDEAQQSQAWRIYRDQRQKADRRENRYREQRERLVRLSANAAQQLRERLAELDRLRNQSLDELFSQLKLRLERIPTRAQRRAWRAAETATSQPSPPVRVETGGP